MSSSYGFSRNNTDTDANICLQTASIDELCDTLKTIDEAGNMKIFISSYSEPYLIDSFKNLFKVFASRKKTKYFNHVQCALTEIINFVNPWASAHIADKLSDIYRDAVRYQKAHVYKTFTSLFTKNSVQIRAHMPTLIPLVSLDANAIDRKTKTLSIDTLTILLDCGDNLDIKPFIPYVLNGIKDRTTISQALDALAGCVFVQSVDASALAIAMPILYRGLQFKHDKSKRKACIIIDNMCKLIDHPKELEPFYKILYQSLEENSENISTPEARNVCKNTFKTLKKVYADVTTTFTRTPSELFEQIIKRSPTYSLEYNEEDINSIRYLSVLLANMCNNNNQDLVLWEQMFTRYSCITSNALINDVFNYAKLALDLTTDDDEDEKDDAKDLYKGIFSLAYGSLTLLNNTPLHLKQNKCYGLLGANNTGKSSLLRAIANEQIEGFPKKDVLKTIFVEHEIKEVEIGEDDQHYPIYNTDLSGSDWVVHCCNEIYKMEPKVTVELAETTLESIGFGNKSKNIGTDRSADMGMPLTTYSGGWKMKMQLCAAILMNADILMLDEPTGHLDVTNIAWLKQWLRDYIGKGRTIIVTSHDSSFLNEMCTHIIDIDTRKLKIFRGTFGKILEEFVDKYPDKKGYFTLKNDVVKFKFPEPGSLDKIKSMSKRILEMKNVSFTYPTRDKPTVQNISLECSRVSRVGVVGPNGAGKSTAIKILIGELKPTTGSVTKYPGMRLAYIAQHAFHHLEKHIHKTPTQYIMWRFAGNEDKEGLDLINKKEVDLTTIKKYYINMDLFELVLCRSDDDEKNAVTPEKLTRRRDNKKTKRREYEVQWKEDGYSHIQTWVPKDYLINMGAIQMVQRYDEKEAIRTGLLFKNLTTVDIEKHFADFGITSEEATHNPIKSLSGGQKVKVVLAASLWQNPHLVILDEPTNYLDRDGLGALTKAIHDFKGGVIIISHNKEFTDAVSQEKWIMDGGRLYREGESRDMNEDVVNINTVKDTAIDRFGNVIDIDRQANLTNKQTKRMLKDLRKQLKKAKKQKLSDEAIDAIEIKIEELLEE